MRFEIIASGAVVGASALEGGDPPMGVAGGRFAPGPGYAAIRGECISARDSDQTHLHLTVRLAAGGETLSCIGVQIVDYSEELGEEGLEVHVLGIPYPLYGELFPHHVQAYERQFKEPG